MESPLTIDEVAKHTGLSAYTLRYYERIGLIAPIRRAPGGQRRYAASDMAWIEFLLRLRATHMPIGKMQTFAKLRDAGDSTVPERRQMLQAHLADVLAAIETMRQSAAALRTKIAHYRSMEQSLGAAPTDVTQGSLNEQHKPLRARTCKTEGNRRTSR